MDDTSLAPELLALDLASIAFPLSRRRTIAGDLSRRISKDEPMYTLSKAKDEIDTVARHATEIASQLMVMSDDINAKLEGFKKELMATIEEKFEELSRKLHGDLETSETSAISDLVAKVSLLKGHPSPVGEADHGPEGAHSEGGEGHHEGHQGDGHHGGEGHHGEHQHGDPEWTQGHAP